MQLQLEMAARQMSLPLGLPPISLQDPPTLSAMTSSPLSVPPKSLATTSATATVTSPTPAPISAAPTPSTGSSPAVTSRESPMTSHSASPPSGDANRPEVDLEIQRTPDGKFRCPFCEKMYNFKHTLKDHINKHTGTPRSICSQRCSQFLDNQKEPGSSLWTRFVVNFRQASVRVQALRRLVHAPGVSVRAHQATSRRRDHHRLPVRGEAHCAWGSRGNPGIVEICISAGFRNSRTPEILKGMQGTSEVQGPSVSGTLCPVPLAPSKPSGSRDHQGPRTVEVVGLQILWVKDFTGPLIAKVHEFSGRWDPGARCLPPKLFVEDGIESRCFHWSLEGSFMIRHGTELRTSLSSRVICQDLNQSNVVVESFLSWALVLHKPSFNFETKLKQTCLPCAGLPGEVHEPAVSEAALHVAPQGAQVPHRQVRGSGAARDEHRGGERRPAQRVPAER